MEDFLLPLLVVLAVVGVVELSYLVYRAIRGERRQANNSIFVDTSVLMDGRIIDVAKSGFITGNLVIPRTVIGELQLLSDGSDSARRTRARHGLDVARELRTMDSVNASLLQDGSSAPEGVDERLLTLAKKHGGSIMTIDYNLNKVAQVEDITVLNINELAKVIRAEHLPGETCDILLMQKGQNAQQAVGYTDDGIMVVVDSAQKKIGSTVRVEITRAIQTDAGRMLFAKIIEDKKTTPAPKPGITKKLLNSNGRSRPSTATAKAASVKAEAKVESKVEKTAKSSSSTNRVEKKPSVASKPETKKTAPATERRSRTTEKPKTPAKSTKETKEAKPRAGVGSQASRVSKSVPADTRADQDTKRPRLYSSRPDTEAKSVKPSVDSGSSVQQGSRASTPKKPATQSRSRARKNPEDDLMNLINSQ